jgi:glycosyltransferase involved in cell wall biosynthesis
MSAHLRVAIVHYHLKRGGVTRVIESTLRGLGQLPEASVSTVVLAGEVTGDFSFQEQAHAVEGLHYSNSQACTPDSETLLGRMRITARKALGGDPDLWHIHNHSLGKNEAMPGVVSLLAEAGEALLLQIHDFAEDGRPGNYSNNQKNSQFADKLYPLGERVHYGLINGRDYAIFAENNIPENQRHQLPNPVEADPTPSDPESVTAIRSSLGADKLFLYPVRALRRKNLGEFLLWSALAEPGEVFATTLGATNPDYRQTYRDWQSLAQRHKLPAHFGIGETSGHPFPAIMQASDCILTTSIAEGFGLSFLEPWLFGKPVAGRDLPEITADFTQQGIQLDALYKNLPIPARWIKEDSLHASIGQHLNLAYAAYGREPASDTMERAIASIRPTEDTYDFGALDEDLQSAVIERLASHPEARQELSYQRFSIPEPGEQAQLIKETYSLDAFTNGLEKLYRNIIGESTSGIDYLPTGNILDSFLMPERFRLLRT